MITVLLLALGGLLLLAALLAPFETLGWWATQSQPEVALSADAVTALNAGRAGTDDAAGTEDPERQRPGAAGCHLVFLSGLRAPDGGVNPRGEAPLLAALKEALPDVVQVTGVYPYSVRNRFLLSGRWSSFLWRLVDRTAGTPLARLVGAAINLRNVLQFAVSADDRYGPMYAIGIARNVWDRLRHHGYEPGSRRPVVLLGWSGGAQIALACSYYLSLLGMPVYVVSLGGVLTSDPGLDRVRHVWHLAGSRDWVHHIGALFPGRWPGRRRSHWARAVAEGRVSVHDVGPVRHVGRGSYLSSRPVAEGGPSCRAVVVATIVVLLAEAGLSATDKPD